MDMSQTNQELIDEAKARRSLAKKHALAEAIATLDEMVAEQAYVHETRVGRQMEHRKNLVEAMDQDIPDNKLEQLISAYTR